MLAFETLVILALSVICVPATHLPTEWCQRIMLYCTAFERNTHPSIPITTVPSMCELVSNAAAFLMPPCILWSPVEQYPSDYVCPKCNSTDLPAPLRAIRWQDGRNPQSAPRKIHGINGPILLVGRVYKCPKGHEVLGYHPGLMNQVPVQEIVPFALWHRTGFTCDLLELVYSLVLTGVTISAITETLQRNRYRDYFKLRFLYRMMHSQLNAPEMPFPSVEDCEQMFGVKLTPSRHSTAAIFLVTFWKKEMLYINEMQKTTECRHE